MTASSRRPVLALAAATLFSLACAAPAPAAAQESPPPFDETQQLLEKVQADKRAVVLKAMALDESEARAFTPVYDEYQLERKKLMQRAVDLLNAYASNYDSMTDDAAKKLLKQWFELQEDERDVVEGYSKKLTHVLPHTKVLRFVQIENKLETLLRVPTVRGIPLAQ